MLKRMRRVTKPIGLAMFSILVLVLPASRPFAQTTAGLPSGEKIMDTYVEATGGIKAYDKLTSVVTTLTMDIPAFGVKLDITFYSARPDRFYSKLASPAIGSQERGTDGTVCWDKSTMTGTRILEGDELAQCRREATFEKYAYWRTAFDKAECTGLDTVDGSPCYRVVLTDKNGKTQTLSFDRKTNLLVKSAGVVSSPQGNIPVEALVSDYRKIGEVLVPFKSVANVGGQKRIMTTTNVEFNVAIPDSIFAMPADVRELLEKKE
jgi:zinc protease